MTSFARILAVLATFVLATPSLGADYAWPIEEVGDAETLYVTLPGLPPELKKVSVRVRGVDTPRAGLKAGCDFERNLARRSAEVVEAIIARGDTIVFRNPKWGKEKARIVATVLVDGHNLARLLIGKGLARPYHPGRRGGWCLFAP